MKNYISNTKRLIVCLTLFLLIVNPSFAALTRQEITITNSVAQILTDYQAKIVITNTDTGFWSAVKTDGSDIRFKDSNENSLPYWLESFNHTTDSATIWVKIPSIPASGSAIIFLDFGDASLTSESSGNSTFVFFDDFSTFDSTKWAISTGGAYSLGTSIITITTGSVYSKTTVAAQQGLLTEAKIKWLNATGNSESGLSIANAQLTATTNASINKLVYTCSGASASTIIKTYAADGLAASYNITSGTTETTIVASTYYILGQAISTDQIITFLDRSALSTYNGSWTSLYYIFLGYLFGSASAATDIADTVFDWVIVRKYASTEPSATLGRVYNIPSSYSFSGYVATGSTLLEGVTVVLKNR